jgi:hypothetical protein
MFNFNYYVPRHVARHSRDNALITFYECVLALTLALNPARFPASFSPSFRRDRWTGNVANDDTEPSNDARMHVRLVATRNVSRTLADLLSDIEVYRILSFGKDWSDTFVAWHGVQARYRATKHATIETLRAMNTPIAVKHVSINTRVPPAAWHAVHCACTLRQQNLWDLAVAGF